MPAHLIMPAPLGFAPGPAPPASIRGLCASSGKDLMALPCGIARFYAGTVQAVNVTAGGN